MSGGLAAEVSVPAAVAGVCVAGTGVAIAGSALSNMFDVRIQKSSKNKEVEYGLGDYVSCSDSIGHYPFNFFN